MPTLLKNRNIILLLNALSLLFLPIPGSGSAEDFETIDGVLHNYNVLHYQIQIEPNELEESLQASVKIKFVSLSDTLRQVAFHARNLKIQRVEHLSAAPAQPLSFSHDSQLLTLHFPEPISISDTVTVSIQYFAMPEAGVYFRSPSKPAHGFISQIYSCSEPENARNWFPCFDAPCDKASSEMIVTVDSSYQVVSNGALMDTRWDSVSRKKTVHWLQRAPHSTYLMCFVAGPYLLRHSEDQNIPLSYFYYPSQQSHAMLTFKHTPRMIGVLGRLFQTPYPWEKYAQIVVHNFDVAGMENTSATFLTDKCIFDHRMHHELNRDDLIVHELAHQWFGNLVTCRDWDNLWINEGFATYAEALYFAETLGPDAAAYHLEQDRMKYLDAANVSGNIPIVYDGYSSEMEMFNSFVYHKGAWVLHMLRFVVGDRIFFSSLKQFLAEYAFSNATVANFQRVVERVSQNDLSWFFKQWLFESGHPIFEVTHNWSRADSTVSLIVRQKQTSFVSSNAQPFRMPVNLEIQSDSDTLLKQVIVSQPIDTFRIHCPRRPRLVRFDKGSWLLKELDFKKSNDEFCYQLLHDSDVIGRLRAIEGLESAVDERAVAAALSEAVLTDSFWGIRIRAAKALEKGNRLIIAETFRKGCTDPNALVRRACVQGLAGYRDSRYAPQLKKIIASDSGYSVVTDALDALAATGDTAAFEIATAILRDADSHEILKIGALHAFGTLKSARSIPTVIAYADISHPKKLRHEALNTLRKFAFKQTQIETFLIQIIHDPDESIAVKAITILGEIHSRRALPILREYARNSTNGRIRRRAQRAVNLIESEGAN